MDYSFTGADVQPRVPASEDANQRQAAKATTRTSWPVAAFTIMQSILFLGHWLLFRTWTSFWALDAKIAQILAATLFVLSVTFTIGSTLAFRYSNGLVRLLYKV